MNISYEYYRVFYYVAKCKSITQAAIELKSNQPNVTRIIKTLEQNLGCPLLIRLHNGVSLTPEGEKLYTHVKIAIETIQAGEEELLRHQKMQEGVVTIAASEVALHCCLYSKSIVRSIPASGSGYSIPAVPRRSPPCKAAWQIWPLR